MADLKKGARITGSPARQARHRPEEEVREGGEHPGARRADRAVVRVRAPGAQRDRGARCAGAAAPPARRRSSTIASRRPRIASRRDDARRWTARASWRRGGLALDIDGPRATITLAPPGRAERADAGHLGGAAVDRRDLPGRRPGGRGARRGPGVLGRPGPAVLLGAREVDGRPGIAGIAALPDQDADAIIAGFQSGFCWLRDPSRVTVAAVQGHAIGAGFQLALACDLRIVADDVQFCMAETGARASCPTSAAPTRSCTPSATRARSRSA